MWCEMLNSTVIYRHKLVARFHHLHSTSNRCQPELKTTWYSMFESLYKNKKNCGFYDELMNSSEFTEQIAGRGAGEGRRFRGVWFTPSLSQTLPHFLGYLFVSLPKLWHAKVFRFKGPYVIHSSFSQTLSKVWPSIYKPHIWLVLAWRIGNVREWTKQGPQEPLDWECTVQMQEG